MPDPEVTAVAEPTPEVNPGADPSPPKSKKTIAIIAVVLVVGLIAAGIFVVKKRSANPAKQEASTEIGATLPLETFVVNLAGDQRAYLRVTLTLGLSHPLVKEKQETGLPMPVIRDTVLAVLSTAKPDELLQTEGKTQLKGQLLQGLQTRLPELGIKDVYFTEFLVQM